MNFKYRSMITKLVLVMFCFTLCPTQGWAALPPTSKVSNLILENKDNQPTNLAGQVQQLRVEFTATSPKEKVVLDMDSRMDILPLSLQPDKDKIEKIVGNKVTLKPDIADLSVVIRFSKPLTVAAEYDVYAKVGRDQISTITKVTVEPEVAVLFNTKIDDSQPERTSFDMVLKLPKLTQNEAGEVTRLDYEGEVKLQLRDKYDNPTDKLPPGKELRVRFEPKSGSQMSDYDIQMILPAQLEGDNPLSQSYQRVKTIPSDKHILGQMTFMIKHSEAPYTSFAVPKIYAALADVNSGSILPIEEVYSDIGFTEKTGPGPTGNESVPTIMVTGSITVGATNNQLRIRIENIYPGAGKRLALTLPKGFVTFESGTNKVYFDFDDIGRFKTVPLAAIPKDAGKKQVYGDKDFSLGVEQVDPKTGNSTPSKDPNDKITVIQLDGQVDVTAGLASTEKSGTKLVLDKKKTAIANGQDKVEAKVNVKDVTGAGTDLLPDDTGLYIWAERDPGKVSTVDAVVTLNDGPEVVPTVGLEDNAIAGVYKVVGELPIDGEVPIGIVSTLDKKATIKSAIAPDAYSATIAKTSATGLVSNTIVATFLPYAATDTWLFKNVTVAGMKTTEVQKTNDSYKVLKTKKSDGTDKFSVTATLDSTGGNVKLANEMCTVTTSDSNLKISSADKNSTTVSGGIQLATSTAGVIKFDLTSMKNGTYTVTVKAKNATNNAGTFTMQVTYDDTGGTIIDGGGSKPDGDKDIVDQIKACSKIVVEDQSSFMLSTGDDLFALYKFYDDTGREISIKSNADARAILRLAEFTAKPTGSTLRNGKDKDITVEAKDGGMLLTFSPDLLGKYTLNMSILNGKSAKVNFNVDQVVKIEKLELIYETTGLRLNGSSSVGKLLFTDSKGNQYEKALPLKGIEIIASGKALEKLDRVTGMVKVLKGDTYSGGIIRVTAIDNTHNLQAIHEFVIGHDILDLEFSNVNGLLHQTLDVGAKIVDEQNRSLPKGALDTADGAQARVTVLSKPKDAKVQTELVDNGSGFYTMGSSVIRVRSDRIGTVKMRVDIRAVDPNFSSKYPVYTYLTGVTEVNLGYPGILDSTAIPSNHDPAKASVMYIGSNMYLSKGEQLYMDSPPFIQDNRTFIPVRAVGDALGAVTTYNAETQTVSIYADGTTATLTLGSPIITTNTKGDIISDVLPFARNNRTFLPLRVIAELYGCQVDAIYDEYSGEMVGVVFSK